jgi:Patatin-like phospholipase
MLMPLLLLLIFVFLALALYIFPGSILKFLGRIYLLRIPLLTAIGLIAFCYLTRSGGTRSLLGGIFDVGDSWLGVFFVSLSAFLTAWVVMATWRLVRLYGPVRNPYLDGQQPGKIFCGSKGFFYLVLYYVLVLLVALPPILLTISTSKGSAAQWLAAVFGFFVSLLCIVAVVWVQLRFTRKDIAERESPDLFLPTQIFLKRRFDVARANNPSESTAEGLTSFFENWPEDVFRGYFSYAGGTVRSILPGHVAATILLALTFLAYVLLGVVKYWRLGEPAIVPTLCYVLLLATLFCWTFSGLAFFLDRYRIPVLIPVAAWLAFTSVLPWSDYFYPVKPLETPSEQVALTGAEPQDDSIIVVAVNGGGIQASAWAAQVLTGLEKACRKHCDRQFDEEVSLISSVSGGSVGTMYFVNEYKDGRIDPNTKLHSIVDRAEGSSIDEISWGVLYPDLVRTILSIPLPFGWDRGRALEEAWLRHDIPWESRAGIEEGLTDWREDAEKGERPAVIFNTTITESGQRLPLATTDMPEGSPGRLNYDQLFASGEHKDIRVVTAARLSASFPYVSPAARAADVEGQASHIVDGGYYDNYGISSLVEWLDAKLRSDQNIDKVLIIEIRGAPSPPSYTFDDAQGCPVKPSTSAPDRRSKAGWFYQYTAPLLTVLGGRDTGQRAHNEIELDLLLDKWDEQDEETEQDEQGKEPHRVEITRALFEFDRYDTPLSWHLSAHDQQNIKDNWQEELTKRGNTCAGWKKVKAFLAEDKSTK